MPRTVWLRAGVRATPADIEQRRRARARTTAHEKAALAEARERWDRGLVRPWVISMTLDAKGLEGPEVDEACGVAEPTVDLWEAGEVYPTFEQLRALAKLTGVRTWFYTTEHRYIDVDMSSLRFHSYPAERTPPVERFQTAAIEAVVGHPIVNPPTLRSV